MKTLPNTTKPRSNIQIGNKRTPPPPSTSNVAQTSKATEQKKLQEEQEASKLESKQSNDVKNKQKDVIGTDTTRPTPVAPKEDLAPVKAPNPVVKSTSTTATPSSSATPTTGLPPIDLKGASGPARTAPTKMAAEKTFGDEEDRTAISSSARTEIFDQRAKGTAKEVTIDTPNGMLRGNFFSANGHDLKANGGQPDTSKPAVLLLTGSGGSAQNQGLEMAKFYQQNGANVLSVNYRGFGNSDPAKGGISEKGLYQDGQAALNHLVGMGYKPENIIIHGYSMGGAVGSKLQAANEANGVKFRGAVYDRPMTSAYEAGKGATNMGNNTTLSPSENKGAKGKVFGELNKASVGNLSTKKHLEHTDPNTRKVVITDNQFLGPSGDEMRTKLQKGNHNVSGQPSGGGHFDHAAALNSNQNALLDLINNPR